MLSMLLTGSLSVEAARKKTVQKIKVACVGNSITYGTGIEDREHFSYPVQLQKMLGDKYLVGNFGKPGATLLNHGHRPYMKQQEYKQAMAFKATSLLSTWASTIPTRETGLTIETNS